MFQSSLVSPISCTMPYCSLLFAIKVGTTLMAYEWLSCFNINNINNFISSQTWTKMSHLDLTSNLWPWALQLELRSQKCCHVQQACRLICIAARSRAMEVVTVSHIHLASRLSSGTRTSRGVFSWRGGRPAGPPFFGIKKILTSVIVLEIDYTWTFISVSFLSSKTVDFTPIFLTFSAVQAL